MTEEIWKDVPGYEGRYQASTHGRIKALKRVRANGRLREEHILSQQTWPQGYKKVTLSNDINPHKTFFVHRIIAITFLDNVNNLPQINHKDENPSNNFVENLEWCTHKYNVNYGNRTKKTQGENNKNHKLTEAEVIEIKKIYQKNSREFGQPSLAKVYGVSRGTIQNIVDGRKWKHLLKEEQE